MSVDLFTSYLALAGVVLIILLALWHTHRAEEILKAVRKAEEEWRFVIEETQRVNRRRDRATTELNEIIQKLGL